MRLHTAAASVDRPDRQAALSLGTLGRQFRLLAVCDGCARVRPMPVGALVGRFGRHTPIATIRGRLRCSTCRSSACGVRLVNVSPAACAWRASVLQ